MPVLARSGSTWIHCSSPVSLANVLMSACSTVRQLLTPRSVPRRSCKPCRPSRTNGPVAVDSVMSSLLSARGSQEHSGVISRAESSTGRSGTGPVGAGFLSSGSGRSSESDARTDPRRRTAVRSGFAPPGDLERLVAGAVPLVDAVGPDPSFDDAGPPQVGDVRESLVDRQLTLVGQDCAGHQLVGERADGAWAVLDRPPDPLQPPHLVPHDRLDPADRIAERPAVTRVDELRSPIPDHL